MPQSRLTGASVDLRGQRNDAHCVNVSGEFEIEDLPQPPVRLRALTKRNLQSRFRNRRRLHGRGWGRLHGRLEKFQLDLDVAERTKQDLGLGFGKRSGLHVLADPFVIVTQGVSLLDPFGALECAAAPFEGMDRFLEILSQEFEQRYFGRELAGTCGARRLRRALR